ncbi:HNH endonuclease family protein [Corynebacterium tapiri]|uniref:HNH endonuclease n=1 Tax=Corynebacterium tapiri TaxID=1448266 RepID=A0A5C4U736_9CORY|nr:HNH endonuclease family protein [Corynebacterium tapiri]TNL99695.1 HNH endonuclease [Corynebacterium tapiri]
MRISLYQLYVLLLSLCTLAAAIAWVLPRTRTSLNDALPPTATLLSSVRIVDHRYPVPGYEREAFGDGWGTRAGCTTREAILASQFPGQGCEASGTTTGMYTGASISPHTSDIDHLFPLAAAWDMGAANWDEKRRVAFANDPLNLIAVDSTANREKSDQLPSEWLPPLQSSRCWYVRRVFYIAATYQLALTRADAWALRRECFLSDLTHLNYSGGRPE